MAYLYNWIRLALCCWCWVHCYVVPRAADLTRSVNWIKKETGNTHNVKNLLFWLSRDTKMHLIIGEFRSTFLCSQLMLCTQWLTLFTTWYRKSAVMEADLCVLNLVQRHRDVNCSSTSGTWALSVSRTGEWNRGTSDVIFTLFFFCFFFFYRSTGSACSVQQRWRRLRQLQHLPVPKNRSKQVRLREDRRLERIVSCCCCSI